MGNDGIRGFALNMIMNNLSPNVRNSPQTQTMIAAIQNNDAATGQQIAENICRSLGLSKEEALQQAINSLGLGNG